MSDYMKGVLHGIGYATLAMAIALCIGVVIF